MKTGTFRRIMIVLSPVLSIGRDCRLGINRYMREQQPSWRIVSHPGWRFADERWLGRWTSPVDGAIVWNFGKISYKGWRGRRTRIIGIINYDLEGKRPFLSPMTGTKAELPRNTCWLWKHNNSHIFKDPENYPACVKPALWIPWSPRESAGPRF